MIEIRPTLQYQADCPHCRKSLMPTNTLWHGMHMCIESTCSGCGAEIVEQLKTGHTLAGGCQFDLRTAEAFGNERMKGWFGRTLLSALQNPESKPVEVVKEVLQPHSRVIILNCIDYLYGHSLLKLLNAQRHLEQHQDYGLIVIVPKFLRWMVPKGVAEIWTVNIPLKQGQKYFPHFNQFMQAELERFEEVQLSEAYSHPSQFDITQFTGVPKHDFTQQQFNITFIWREDRPWCSSWLYRLLRKLNLLDWALMLQNWKIHRLMNQLRAKVPEANFVIAGLGKKTRFSGWIEDCRVNVFDENTERQLCKVYSDSRLIIGVHGSNMLLPSGHAGMTIDLMPDDRWVNFAQDILYQEADAKLATYRYRFFPTQMEIRGLAEVASSMFQEIDQFNQSMSADK
jgi:hypothetical protein